MSRVNIEGARINDSKLGSGLKYGVTVLPDGNQTIDMDMGPVVVMTPTVSRNLTLPAVTADMIGATLYFMTQAAFTLVIKNAAAGTVATVPATVGATGMVTCLGDSTLGIGGWVGGM
jgi:hypothetical protein